MPQLTDQQALSRYCDTIEARNKELEAMLRSTKAMLDEIAEAAGFRRGDTYSAQTIIARLRGIP